MSFESWYESAHPAPAGQTGSAARFGLALVILGAIIFAGHVDQKTRSTQEYEVLSVSRGAVHVLNRSDGSRTAIKDQALARKALAGQIKKGDVIYLD